MFDVLESNNVVAWLNGSNTLTDGLDDASTFVSQDDGEGAFGVFAGECVSICALAQFSLRRLVELTCVYQYGRHPCSVSGCGLRVLLEGQLRRPQWRGPCRPPRPRRPFRWSVCLFVFILQLQIETRTLHVMVYRMCISIGCVLEVLVAYLSYCVCGHDGR